MRYPFLSIAFLLNFLFACRSASGDNTTTNPNAKQYLALGDSYTIGESVDRAETYPQQLTAVLNQQNEGFAAPTIIAKTGWTTADLQRGIKNASIEGKKYDLISLLIGVNNEFQGRSLAEFENEFTNLLNQAIEFAKDKQAVFVLSIPDYGYTPFGMNKQASISARIDLFNEVAEKASKAAGVRYVYITDISRKGFANPTWIAGDGLHPSGLMYGEFVQRILKD